MTQEENDLLYRILFENSNEEPTAAIYEVYDTVTELIANKQPLPHKLRTLQ